MAAKSWRDLPLPTLRKVTLGYRIGMTTQEIVNQTGVCRSSVDNIIGSYQMLSKLFGRKWVLRKPDGTVKELN